MGKKNKKKVAKYIKTPNPSKTPKYTRDPEGYQDRLIAWHFHRMDNSGEWACNHETLKLVSGRLHEYENQKWSEVMAPRSSNHPMPVDKIEPKALKRLSELTIDDTENLYQLEIKGFPGKSPRLWGLRQENIFQILWWDLDHTVYRSKNYKR